ncbi:MAG TPA: disulfide bond formation protein B [Methylocystis sp.]|nr:disulfide bond formation protein B [Methylocystis sp.]
MSRFATRGVVALLIFAAAVAAIGGAWIIEAMGYKPCELCLLGRVPYYVGIALALATALAAWRGFDGLARVGFAALALVFLAGVGIAAYHAGVEYKFWPGPKECTGSLTKDLSPEDFLAALRRVKPVRCDEPALVILGLSLAGWSALISLAFSALAAFACRSGFGSAMRRDLQPHA